MITTKRARGLRSKPSYVESYLWKHLRDRRFEGLKFRRQVAIGPYVADFVSYAARLVVEVDGGIHRLRQESDRERDIWLTGQGFTVLRFPNQMVLNSPTTVFAAIARVAEAKLAPHPTRQAGPPSPARGEGARLQPCT